VLLKNLLYAFGTLALIVAIQRFFRGFMATVAVLIGLVAGTLVAWLLGDARFEAVASSPALGYTLPFHFGWPTFSLTAMVSMIVVMLITMVESTGDVYATGEIVRKRIRRDDIARTLRADGLATLLGGVLNSFPYTCYAENVGLVRLTQIKSRWVVCAAGVIMLILGSMPKAAAIVAGIPHPVLGGAALAMFAAVAVVGIQTLAKVDFNDHRNLVIVGSSLGLAMLVTSQPYVSAAVPSSLQIFFGSGITLGALAAILLNALFFHFGDNRHAAVAGRPGERLVTLEQVNAMSFETFAKTFGGLVESVPWVLERAWAQRPYADPDALRAAFQEALLSGDEAQQLELLNAYADLGSEDEAGSAYIDDHAEAGLGSLGEDEHDEVRELARAYRRHFGFPLVVCARDVERYERVLAQGWSRLANAPAVERASAIVEAARIASYRFNDRVADANPIETARQIRFLQSSP
jgi:OHCU decarboxylase